MSASASAPVSVSLSELSAGSSASAALSASGFGPHANTHNPKTAIDSLSAMDSQYGIRRPAARLCAGSAAITQFGRKTRSPRVPRASLRGSGPNDLRAGRRHEHELVRRRLPVHLRAHEIETVLVPL